MNKLKFDSVYPSKRTTLTSSALKISTEFKVANSLPSRLASGSSSLIMTYPDVPVVTASSGSMVWTPASVIVPIKVISSQEVNVPPEFVGDKYTLSTADSSMDSTSISMVCPVIIG